MRKNAGISVRAFADPTCREALFEQARAVRDSHFGSKVFAYGFDYFSTYCKNKCAFCLYRNGNSCAPRYRHALDDIVRSAKDLADSGVHLIDLTMGEDPYYLEHPQRLVDIVDAVRQETGLPIMVSPGALDSNMLKKLRDAGATWFALYQETFDREAFSRLRMGQCFDERIRLKSAALEAGLLVEEGLLTGWGDTPLQLLDSIEAMDGVFPSQVRVMTFLPQPGSPLESRAPLTSERELVAIAIMRILYPDLLIPASLDVEGAKGLRARLDAGANVITSLIPAGAGLEGVARNVGIEDGSRSLPQVMDTIHAAGLRLASQLDYEEYIQKAHARCRIRTNRMRQDRQG